MARKDGKLNVTLDPDAVEQLQRIQAAMSAERGFEPTLSQALKRLIAKYRETTDPVGYVTSRTGDSR